MRKIQCLIFLTNIIISSFIFADTPDELKVKREAIYEFIKKPAITKDGNNITIRFETKGFCDVTIAIEDKEGNIVRHLASGVLGVNAPVPFIKDSKAQEVIWDGKNDKGEYVKDLEELSIRVSLGLNPKYEKSLMWDPHKRVSRGGVGDIFTEDMIPQASQEGVYIYDGNGVDHVRLFDHEGVYVKTVYPFPANKIKEITDLKWNEYPQGYSRPEKHGLNQTTFLTSGNVNSKHFQQSSASTVALKPRGETTSIALIKTSLNRLSSLGSLVLGQDKKALPLSGGKTYITADQTKWDGNLHKDIRYAPYCSAFSPDGKKLYLSGYSSFQKGWGGRQQKHWIGAVMCLDFEENKDAVMFTGSYKADEEIYGGLAVDKQGRVYVSKYIENKVDVYSEKGELLKSIEVNRPTTIQINQESGEIFVFSWFLGGLISNHHPKLKDLKVLHEGSTLTVFESFENPKVLQKYILPRISQGSPRRDSFDTSWGETRFGTQIRATVDFWAKPFRVWFVHDSKSNDVGDFSFRTKEDLDGLLILEPDEKKELKIIKDFSKEVKSSIVKTYDNLGHMRVYVNPADKMLYAVDKDSGVGNGEMKYLYQIDPQSGNVKKIRIPLGTAEDLAFDLDGLIYFREVKPNRRVVRYEMNTWREVPFDYGVEGVAKKEKGSPGDQDILSALKLPSNTIGWWSEGGIWVSPKGNIAVWCSTFSNDEKMMVGRKDLEKPKKEGYIPPLYPGRKLMGAIHIWDKHGKLLKEDAAPGVSMSAGMAIDQNDDIYLMSWCPRVYQGKKYQNFISGTLLKVTPQKNKWYSNRTDIDMPLLKSNEPKRELDLSGYTMGGVWVDGAHWFYGGVGNCSFKIAPGCICWQHSRFTLDYFARSFAPEVDQFSVAVLDSYGNLILRIGQYGNVDDGLPLSKDSRFISPNAKSIGGDEVSLMHGSYVATESDKYLYISDVGNGRIVQVKLDYHVNEKISLGEH